ncbi:MAG: hypothetical protein KME43_19265 [Myxacorys chilensis ATA2-1-KO14]|jgi:hypothetical protein|nr:hypothetical protein [Myxacorys chilensis ATA2-1-KO14]
MNKTRFSTKAGTSVPSVGRPASTNLTDNKPFRYEKDIYALVEQEAKATGQSVADVVRVILRGHYTENNKDGTEGPSVDSDTNNKTPDSDNQPAPAPLQNSDLGKLTKKVDLIFDVLFGKEPSEPTDEVLEAEYEAYSAAEDPFGHSDFEEFKQSQIERWRHTHTTYWSRLKGNFLDKINYLKDLAETNLQICSGNHEDLQTLLDFS